MNSKCTHCGYKQDISHHGVIECVNCGMRFPSSPKFESAVMRGKRNLRWDMVDGISIDEMESYGYLWDKIVPLKPDTALMLLGTVDVYRLFDDGGEVVMEHPDDDWNMYMYGIDVDDVRDVIHIIKEDEKR